jgi:hypothetical protein
MWDLMRLVLLDAVEDMEPTKQYRPSRGGHKYSLIVLLASDRNTEQLFQAWHVDRTKPLKCCKYIINSG